MIFVEYFIQKLSEDEYNSYKGSDTYISSSGKTKMSVDAHKRKWFQVWKPKYFIKVTLAYSDFGWV